MQLIGFKNDILKKSINAYNSMPYNNINIQLIGFKKDILKKSIDAYNSMPYDEMSF